MDESQKRKISAKEFIEKNRKLGFGIIGIFISLFVIYFAFIFFYSHEISNSKSDNSTTTSSNDITDSFFGSLLPTFNEATRTNSEIDNSFLSNFAHPNRDNIDSLTGKDDSKGGDNSKIIKIEDKPILGYKVFDKPISILSYIKIKPKICAQKLESVTKKETKSPSVLVFQDMLGSMEGYSDIATTSILDQATRDKLYIFQTRYADILYKNKNDRTPTRVVDKETTHFLNLLCGFEKENKDDFVQVPTLRYITSLDRQIYDYNTDSKQKFQVDARVASNTQDVTFSSKGDYVVFRSGKDGQIISDFYDIKIKSLTHLENNITSLDFNDNDLLIYGVPGADGMTIKSYDHLHNSIKKVASIPLNEWNLLWISTSEIGIFNKPSAYAQGIYMILNTDSKQLRQLAGPSFGLSLQKTNIKDFTILSTGGQGSVKTLLLNNNTRNIGDFGISTFAEKCSRTIFADGVFCAVPQHLDSNLVYPDDWYKGKISTQDIIMYKTLTGTTTKVVSYLENQPISIINLEVNKNGIFFMDENTLQLYALEI